MVSSGSPRVTFFHSNICFLSFSILPPKFLSRLVKSFPFLKKQSNRESDIDGERKIFKNSICGTSHKAKHLKCTSNETAASMCNDRV